MEKTCFNCERPNESGHIFCDACGSPLALSSYVDREIANHLAVVTRDRTVLETESAIRVFERAWGWVKLLGGVLGALAAILVGAGIWQYIDLHSTAKSATIAVAKSKESAETSITSMASGAKMDIEQESTKSVRDIRTAADSVKKSSEDAQTVAKDQSAAIRRQAGTFREQVQSQAAVVGKDVASARQQIQAASQLQPQIAVLQKQLALAQGQIQEQQKVITSSEDFAKKIFSSHKRFSFDIKTMEKSQYAIVDAGQSPDGIQLSALYLIIPSTPVEGTLDIQFNQTMAAPGSFGSIHNVAVIILQKPSQDQLTGKPITLGYFPDPEDKMLLRTLTVKEGRAFADNMALPFGKQDGAPIPLPQK